MRIASWKTKSAGAGGLIALVAAVIQRIYDGDPTTSVDWGLTISTAFALVIGLFSRDDKVTSEQAGAKATPVVTLVQPLEKEASGG